MNIIVQGGRWAAVTQTVMRRGIPVEIEVKLCNHTPPVWSKKANREVFYKLGPNAFFQVLCRHEAGGFLKIKHHPRKGFRVAHPGSKEPYPWFESPNQEIKDLNGEWMDEHSMLIFLFTKFMDERPCIKVVELLKSAVKSR